MLLSIAASECRLGMSSFICEANGMSSAVSLATHIQIVKFILNMHKIQWQQNSVKSSEKKK